MSPASQGALEVERYIGSCLISSGCCAQPDSATPQQHRSGGAKQFWAGGAPLVQQQQQQQQSAHNRVPLSRLAVHTQGAPLILSAQRYHGGRPLKQPPPPPPPLFGGVARAASQQQQPAQRIAGNRLHASAELKKALAQPLTKASEAGVGGTNVASIDSLSIASDESSGSNNSENSLPRIIKPRKRRKKDRKPPLVPTASQKPVAGADGRAPAAGAGVEEGSAAGASQYAVPSSAGSQPESARLRCYSYDGHQRYGGADHYYRRAIGARAQTQGPAQQQEVVDTRQQQQQQQQQQRFAHRHVQVKVLDDNRNVVLPVPVCPAAVVAAAKASGYLRQPGGARLPRELGAEPAGCRARDVGDECAALCQCRYCEPAALLWDVADRASFAGQYLGQPALLELGQPQQRRQQQHQQPRYAPLPLFLAARPLVCQEHAGAVELFDVAAGADGSCLRLRPAGADRPDGAALLRRSWSDPTSYFSDELLVPNRDVGVIGDRGGARPAEAARRKKPWRGDALSVGSGSPVDQPASPTSSCGSGGAGSPGLQGPLEVSTEIVTSPNGHRDLEIKFYSSSPTGLARRHRFAAEGPGAAVAFAFPDDEDSEEFSDIWSYHESQLQQDFRTLLQAGED